jgi:hypothetical protein
MQVCYLSLDDPSLKRGSVMAEPHEIVTRQVQEISRQINLIAGAEISNNVMKGSQEALVSADPVETALWAKDALHRLDVSAAPDTCQQIMNACGCTCLAMNIKGLEESREMRLKCSTEEEFLQLELNATPQITRYERNGNILNWYYTPRKLGNGLRCVCPLFGKLPEGVNASPTYCQCSRAFVQGYWEGILGRPLKVELGATSLIGAEDCHFIIHL